MTQTPKRSCALLRPDSTEFSDRSSLRRSPAIVAIAAGDRGDRRRALIWLASPAAARIASGSAARSPQISLADEPYFCYSEYSPSLRARSMTPHAPPARKAGLASTKASAPEGPAARRGFGRRGLGRRRAAGGIDRSPAVPVEPAPRARRRRIPARAPLVSGHGRRRSDRRRRGRRLPKTGAVCSQPLEFEQNQKIKIFTGFHSPRLPAGGGIAAP